MKPDIVVAPLLYAPVMAGLEHDFTVHALWRASDPIAFLVPLADRIRGFASFNSYPVSAELIASLPKLEIIAAMSVGVDHIDLEAARARRISVTNAPDVLTDCVADLGIALLLAVSRRVAAGDRFVRGGNWLKAGFPLSTKVGGKTMGIVGLGRIGKAVAQRAQSFGMRIVYYGRRRQDDVVYPFFGDLKAMAAVSHYLMLTCPGGAATRHLIDREVLAALGPEGVVINIARGSVVDEAALVTLLTAGRLGGAGLDVFADEPRVPEALFSLDSVVLTPHVASATHATRAAMGQLMIDNLKAHFAGQPVITPVA